VEVRREVIHSTETDTPHLASTVVTLLGVARGLGCKRQRPRAGPGTESSAAMDWQRLLGDDVDQLLNYQCKRE
jgi:hypothetical protein